MDREQVLALYDAEVRANPAPQPGVVVERCGPVVRLTGPFKLITFWDLTTQAAPAAVAEQAAALGEGLLWRVYDHDGPPDLGATLASAGFEPEEPGTLMVLDLDHRFEAFAPKGVEVRRVGSLADLDAFVTAAGRAFGAEETWRRHAYAGRLDDPDLGLYVAYVSGEPAASARLEMGQGRAFGLLFGGGVDPRFRRRGLYRALVAARVAEARRRGLRFLSTEARETSRPILQSLGFAPLARETTWVLR